MVTWLRRLTLGALVLGLLAPGRAAAHVRLVRSEPTPHAVLERPPGRVLLVFSGRVVATGTPIEVRDSLGRLVAHGGASLGDTAVVLALPSLPRGAYTVRWGVLSPDGHPIEGTFGFRVAGRAEPEPRGAPAAHAAGPTRPPPGREVVRAVGVGWLASARWFHLLGLITLAGPWLLAALHRRGERPVPGLRAMAGTGIGLLLAAAVWGLLAQATAVGQVTHTGFAEALAALLVGGVWGGLWWARLGATLALLPAVIRWRTPPLAWTALPWLVLLLATAANGHAATTPPVALSIGLQVAHVAAAVAWVGGLLALGLLVLWPSTRYPSLTAQAEAVRRCWPRFSRWALRFVVVLVLAGSVEAWRVAGWPWRWLDHPYGAILLAKTLLFAGTLLAAAFQRFLLLPALARGDDDVRVLARGRVALGFETGLTVAVLALAALLASTPPPERAPAPAAPAAAARP